MNNFKQLKIPNNERLEVQLLDGTDEHNIDYIITSEAKLAGRNEIIKMFKLYSVDEDGKLSFIEKGRTPLDFKTLERKE